MTSSQQPSSGPASSDETSASTQVPAAPAPAPAPASDANQFVLTLPDDPSSGKDWYLWAGVMVLLVLTAFLPCVTGKFIWDDDHHVSKNTSLETLQGLRDIWTPPGSTPQYYPMTHTTFWLEYHLWQLNPLGYHVVNILLHALSAVLVWRLLRRLSVPGAWVAAAIWAIHPLQAESVCWISERKNILSGLLFFASIWFYLEFSNIWGDAKDQADRPWGLGNRWLAYALSLVLFTAALLSKTVVCAMPAVVLVFLWWKGRKLAKEIFPLIPFFAVGLLLALYTVHLETSPTGLVQAQGPEYTLSMAQRVMIAGRNFWFYIGKLFWPSNLAFSYPRVVPDVHDAMQWLPAIAAVVLLAALWALRKQIGRGPLAAVLYYVITLFPALGFFNTYPFRYSFVADHFQYLSGLGIIVLVVAAVHHLIRRRAGAAAGEGIPDRPVVTTHGPTPEAASTRLRWSVGVASALIVLCAGLSWLQSRVYADPITLWRDTLEKNPSSWMAHDNLAAALIDLGKQEARQAPIDRAHGDADLAQKEAEASTDDYRQAETLLEQSLQLHPDNFRAYVALGDLRMQVGQYKEAEQLFRKAIEQMPSSAAGRPDASPYLELGAALRSEHEDGAARAALAQALEQANKEARIRATSRRAPSDLAAAHYLLGQLSFEEAQAAARAGDEAQRVSHTKEALDELLKATQIYDASDELQGSRANIDAHLLLGRCYIVLDDTRNAEIQFSRAAVLSSPQGINAEAETELGWVKNADAVKDQNDPVRLHSDITLAQQLFQEALKQEHGLPSAVRGWSVANLLIPLQAPATMPAPGGSGQSALPATQPFSKAQLDMSEARHAYAEAEVKSYYGRPGADELYARFEKKFKEALAAQPNIAGFLELAGYYQAHGQSDRAMDTLRQANDFAHGKDPGILTSMGQVTLRSTRDAAGAESAAQYFQQALRLKPDFEPAKKGLDEVNQRLHRSAATAPQVP